MAHYIEDDSFDVNINKAASEIMEDKLNLCAALDYGFPFKYFILENYLSPYGLDTNDYWFDDREQEDQEDRYILLLFYKEIYLSEHKGR